MARGPGDRWARVVFMFAVKSVLFKKDLSSKDKNKLFPRFSWSWMVQEGLRELLQSIFI